MSTATERAKELKEKLEELKDTKAKLEKLKDLSDRAESGDEEARYELRRALRASSPEIVARVSDLAKRGRRILIETAASGEPVMEEGLWVRLELMRTEIAGENPTPLELLLTERIASCWLLVELLEVLMSAQLRRGSEFSRSQIPYLRFFVGWQEQAHRRFLSAIRELARVRKLQSNTPSVQVNTQINVSGG